MFGIDDAITAGTNMVTTIANKFAPDATSVEHDKMVQALAELNDAHNEVLGQLDINKTEAASASLFVSGWRPAVGWICAASFGYVTIVEPLARFIAVVIFAYTGTFPVISTEITLQALFAILGIGGLRTYEKKIGVTK